MEGAQDLLVCQNVTIFLRNGKPGALGQQAALSDLCSWEGEVAPCYRGVARKYRCSWWCHTLALWPGCVPPASLVQVSLAVKQEVRLDNRVQPQDVATLAGECDTVTVVALGMGAPGGSCLSLV